MSDIRTLREAVEAGETDFKIGELCFVAGFSDHAVDVLRANSGSIDAAKALHDAMLPDGSGNGGTNWSVEIRRGGMEMDEDWLWRVEISDGNSHVSCDVSEDAAADTPARAWLLAILKALEARDNG